MRPRGVRGKLNPGPLTAGGENGGISLPRPLESIVAQTQDLARGVVHNGTKFEAGKSNPGAGRSTLTRSPDPGTTAESLSPCHMPGLPNTGFLSGGRVPLPPVPSIPACSVPAVLDATGVLKRQ